MLLIILIILVLTVIGLLSPFLTLLALFQQKEWRLDRLWEHLRREGLFRQLYGKIRLPMALWFIATDEVLFLVDGDHDSRFVLWLIAHCAWIAAFAFLALQQFATQRQRVPVWTQKAKSIAAASFLWFGILFYLTQWQLFILFTGLLYLLVPVMILLGWMTLLPLDHFLKNTHFLRAEKIRRSWTDATVIGIAGSVGKTTVKELLKHVLSDLQPIATPEHVNTEMGVAMWMEQGDRRPETGDRGNCFIIEMGAYRKGEIRLMCSFVKPTIGVMTAVGSDHLALFGSEEAIVDANAELLEALPEDGQAFLYADNTATRSMEERCPCVVTLAGEDPSATIRAQNIEQKDDGLHLIINGHTVRIALHGLHNVGNILLVVAVARHLGIPDTRIAELLESFHPLQHTFSVKKEGDVLLVDDTYNSSRLSILAALDWAKHRTERPRTLLLSGLLETGSAEEDFLTELGSAAKGSVDRVIFLNSTGKAAFEKGYGQPIEILSTSTEPTPHNSLLLAIGRMPLSSIQKLLPPLTNNQ